jgi:hypothetical protein
MHEKLRESSNKRVDDDLETRQNQIYDNLCNFCLLHILSSSDHSKGDKGKMRKDVSCADEAALLRLTPAVRLSRRQTSKE